MGGCSGTDPQESERQIGEKRGIKRGNAGSGRRRQSPDTPWITFDQFFEVMSESMTQGVAPGESIGSKMIDQNEIDG